MRNPTVHALAAAAALALAPPSYGQPSLSESAGEPVRYVGPERSDPRFFDGRLRHAVGVHRYQALRANRLESATSEPVGWTYNHAPMLAHWRGRFHLQWVSNLKEEHGPPGRTMLATSIDGFRWSHPQVLFPEYVLPEVRYRRWSVPDGTLAVMHQRMGFYVAPNGRLLTLAFYSYSPTTRDGPNDGQGLGRVVREIRDDGSFGPIFFIRYNRHAGWSESNTRYPLYTASDDAGFVAACEALLADKLVTLQWWEDDRSEDGFYSLDPGDLEPKALSWYHRPDGVVVGLWKRGLSALSPDDGASWTPLVESGSLWSTGAKIWGQRTGDGRYAIVYNHSATRRNRFPLAVMTGDDGHAFDELLLLHGEVPPKRYQGIHKPIGLQYVRGITEGNGDPPGDHMWNTYSMSKEDIWVSRARVPIEPGVAEPVADDFEGVAGAGDLELWSLHVPQWAPVSVEDEPGRDNRCLELRDEDPWDYAVAERPFPEAERVSLSFRVWQERVGHGLLDVEVQGPRSERPMRLRFEPGLLSMDRGGVDPDPVPIGLQRWHRIELALDARAGTWDLTLDGEPVRTGIPFAVPVSTLQRVVFRTGPWRGDVPLPILERAPATRGLQDEDLPGAGHKVPLSVFRIDDVRTGPGP